MFASPSNKFRMEVKPSLSNTNTTHAINTNQLTLSTTTHHEDNLWANFKAFFNPQNSMIILAIICLVFFLITLCLVFIILQLIKKKRLYQNQTKPATTDYPKLDHRLHFPSSPIQMGLTSNQIASLGNIIPTNREIKVQESPLTTKLSSSVQESNKTQSFDNFESELKQTWYEKGITSSNTTNLSATHDDEVETVNEVLGMEERNGKVYYKVNFTGHPSDYTAWVCEEDLIPE